MNRRKIKTMKTKGVPVFVGIFLCLAIFGIISGLTTLYADDFYYATFFKNGFLGFLQENIRHYQVMNGRALVHLVDQFVLLFGTPLFAILNPAMLCCFFCFLGKTMFDEDKEKKHGFLLSSLALTLFLPQIVAKESLYWITGSMNYLFPFVLTVFAMFLQQRAALQGKTKWWYFLFCFLSGATTEQGGAASFVILTACAICTKLQNRKAAKEKICGFGPSLFALLGYLTVILSPGTLFRASYEGGPLFSRLGESFMALSALLMGKNGIVFYLAVLFLLVSILSALKKGLPRLFGLSLIPCLVFLGIGLQGKISPDFEMAPEASALFLCVAILACFLLSIGFLQIEGYKKAGLLLLGAMATQGVMLFAPSTYLRTLLPTMLFLTASIAFLCVVLFSGHKKAALLFLGALLLFAAAYIAPTVNGYWQNKKVALKNEASIKAYEENGCAEICVDIDSSYGYTMFYEDGFFTKYFYQYYNLPENPILYYGGAEYQKAYFNKERLTHPAVQKGDALYLPLASVAEKKGATLSWQGDTLTIEMDTRAFTLEENVLTVAHGSYFQDIKSKSTRYFGKIYWEKALLTEIFNVTVLEKDGAVYITENES